MGKYVSRLKQVLSYLKIQEELAEAELAERNLALAVAEEKLSEAKQILELTLNNLKMKETEGILPHELEQYLEFIRLQSERLKEEEGRIRKLTDEYEISRERLAMAVKERKVIQKIESGRYEAFLVRSEKREQEAVDEVAARSRRRIP